MNFLASLNLKAVGLLLGLLALFGTIAYIGHLYSEQVDIATESREELVALKASYALEKAKAEAEIAEKLKVAELQNQQNINNSNIIQEKLKDYYEKRLISTNKELQDSNNQFVITRDWLRDTLRRNLSTEIITPKDTGDTEGWRNSYSTVARQYEELKYACAQTTDHFNVCRIRLDSDCQQVGCSAE